MRGKSTLRLIACGTVLALALPVARADVITDWNEKACQIVASVGPGSMGHRYMAIVQVATYDAVSSISNVYKPLISDPDSPREASIEAAVASANRTALLELMPQSKPAIEAAYQAALAHVPNGVAREEGIAVGEKAAAAVLARASQDGAQEPETYVPHAAPGVYVPTMVPVFTTWANRKPWVMDRPDQFRPGPPPALDSETWVRDYNEIAQIGGKGSKVRSAEQTEIAKFWEETRPLVYHPVLKSVADLPRRTVAQNARLYAAATMAVDDALIAVFDAKYKYNFWRPITAIRTGGGNKMLSADPRWSPFINTPMHPEYPCAHCVSAGAVGAIIAADIGSTPVVLSSTSPSSANAKREWRNVDSFVDEVSSARIYDGVHYRNSTVVGTELGRKVGRLVAARMGMTSP